MSSSSEVTVVKAAALPVLFKYTAVFRRRKFSMICMPQHLQVLLLDMNIYLAAVRDISRHYTTEGIICSVVELWENKPTSKL